MPRRSWPGAEMSLFRRVTCVATSAASFLDGPPLERHNRRCRACCRCSAWREGGMRGRHVGCSPLVRRVLATQSLDQMLVSASDLTPVCASALQPHPRARPWMRRETRAWSAVRAHWATSSARAAWAGPAARAAMVAALARLACVPRTEWAALCAARTAAVARDANWERYMTRVRRPARPVRSGSGSWGRYHRLAPGLRSL